MSWFKRSLGVACAGALGVVLTLGTGGQAQAWGTLHSGCNRTGSAVVVGTVSNLHDYGWGDITSSVDGLTQQLRIYEHINSGGASATLSPGYWYEFGCTSDPYWSWWNNRISSTYSVNESGHGYKY